MDAVCDPFTESVVIMSSAQIGKTEVISNVLGYYIDQDPAPILMVQPTLQMGQAYSKDRLAPMLRDSPVLQGRVKDVKAKDSGNTILHKIFTGGHITISGANSPASLASRPVRIVILEELDRFPLSAGSEGDPSDLARKRNRTFWNRKTIMNSTPTIKGASRIETAYEQSDQRKYYVPCPHCDESQVLKWANVRWDKGKPADAWYECDICHVHLTDLDKPAMIRAGQWRATAESKGTAGFWINELYSPWSTWGEMAVEFLKAKQSTETLRVFVNTSLGETWEDEGETLEDDTLFNRRERYGPTVPMNACIITAGVDVQDDRLHLDVTAWGPGEESWAMEHKIFHGDPALPDVWNDIDIALQHVYTHESGARLPIACTLIDSGGHHTQMVYSFVKSRHHRRIYACKGANTAGAPLVGRPTTRNAAKVKLFMVGSSAAKETIYSRLRIDEFGPGYCHFRLSNDFNEAYFMELTAEKIITKYHRGFPTRVWQKIRPRNEALDCRVYGYAALLILNVNLEKLSAKIQTEHIEMAHVKPHKRNRGGFVKGWKR